MKTLRIFSMTVSLALIACMGFSQDTKTETLKISGECGMCKKKIEKAAKDAGATYAIWSVDTKVLTVKYNSVTTNTAKIEQKIAGVGYDTPNVKATDEAYNALHACCKYERSACCTDKCEMKDGKCKDESVCKEKGCCNDNAVCKEKGCCSKDEDHH
jgi:periplasmic mercuric ion binding protein